MNYRVAAVIVAAGSSRRMGTSCSDKLLLKIKDTEVLARTMIQYQKASSVDEIYVVTRADLIENVKQLAKQYGISKFAGVALGGKTRQQSVQNGVALCGNADFVAIADGARPFTKPEDIDKVTAAAQQHGGAVLCVAVKDTVKVAANGLITLTPPRESLLLAQTPQTFKRDIFADLINQAIKEERQVTDDASVFEIYGKKVAVVIGDYDNIKITTAEDILQAETIAGKECL